MSVVLGVDPSLTVSGVALVEWDNTEPAWSTWRGFGVKPETVTVASTRRRIRKMLADILHRVPARLDLAVIEGPAMAATYTPLGDERAGLRWMLVDQLLARGPVVLLSPSTRQALTGVGSIPRGTSAAKRKAAVTEAVRALVPAAHVADHNVADAVALAAAGAHRVGLPVPYTVKQLAVHGRAPWPVDSGQLLAGKE